MAGCVSRGATKGCAAWLDGGKTRRMGFEATTGGIFPQTKNRRCALTACGEAARGGFCIIEAFDTIAACRGVIRLDAELADRILSDRASDA